MNTVIVIGGGLAGLSAALRLADRNISVTILAKVKLSEGSTRYAQGGLAAVRSEEDSFQSHIDDTHTAGGGLCKPETVDFVVKNAPGSIQWLIDRGVSFSFADDNKDEYHLTREGGHSFRRVIHAADATGAAVEETLEEIVRAHPLITLLEDHIAIDLITTSKLGLNQPNQCVGVYAFDQNRKTTITLSCEHMILATGGASKVYLYTSNPDTSTGDGIAMAWRAGCRVANMAFVQFHPTCMYHPHAKSFLISEAVRGEGGRLVHADGSRFMSKYDERLELAPRDIVARAIDFEMKKNGYDSVYLDISHQPEALIQKHFPTIRSKCLEFGIDILQDPIPVVPAAHYTCGGVMTDLKGRTDINRLYAVGETSYTGLHGANRLASNSLVECLVFAESAASDIIEQLENTHDSTHYDLPNWDESQVTDPDEQIVVSHNWDELRRCMWDYVGIVRTNKRLTRAAHRIQLLQEEIRDFYSNFKISGDLIELRNLVQVADLTVRSAMLRKESRGLHTTRDYPNLDTSQPPRETILTP